MVKRPRCSPLPFSLLKQYRFRCFRSHYLFLALLSIASIGVLAGCNGTGASGGPPAPTPTPSPTPQVSNLSVVSTTPSAGNIGVSQLPTISIAFNKSIAAQTVTGQNFVMNAGAGPLPTSVSLSSDGTTVTLTPNGLLEASANYKVSVTQSVTASDGSQLPSNFSFAFTTQTAINVTAQINAPSGVNATTLRTLSFSGTESTPDPSGNVQVALRPIGTTVIFARVPNTPFGLSTVTVGQSTSQASNRQSSLNNSNSIIHKPKVHYTRYQITASPRAASSTEGLVVDFQTTAESMVFLVPAIYNTDPGRVGTTLSTIASDPNTSALATALGAALNESDPLANPQVQTALQTAARSVLRSLGSNSAGSMAARSEVGDARALVQLSSQSQNISTTPYCWNAPNHIEQTSGGLQCLDLDFVRLPSPMADTAGNFIFSPDTSNCPIAASLGCATGWLGTVSTIANLPTAGVDSISAGTGSAGPDSPTGPLGSGCAIGSAGSGCVSLLWLPGQSSFRFLDLEGDITEALQNFSGLGGNDTFSLPGVGMQNYIARFYSGGLADSVELNNIFAGSYPGGLALWSEALAMNELDSAGELLDATGVIPSGVTNCLITQYVTTHLLSEATQLQGIGPGADLSSIFLSGLGNVAKDFVEDAGGCIIDSGLEGFLQELREIGEIGSVVGDVFKILQATSDISQVAQRVIEMGTLASPVETAIITQGTVQSSRPTIGVISPNQVVAGQSITLIVKGVNFQRNFSASVSSIFGTFAIANAGLTFVGSSEVHVQVTMGGTPPFGATLTITNPDNSSATGNFQVIAGSGGTVTIKSISPGQVVVNQPTTLIVMGTNFQQNFSASVSSTFGTFSIANTGLTFVSSSEVHVQVTMGGTPPFGATLTITNPDNSSATGNFQVITGAAPTISVISPGQVVVNQPTTLTVMGSNFERGFSASVSSIYGTFAIASAGLAFVSSSEVQVLVTMGGTPPFQATLTITNPDGSAATGNYQVVGPSGGGPSINSISPNPVIVNQPTILTVMGANFQQSFSASVSSIYGTFAIANAGLTFVSSSEVRVQVTMGGTPPFGATLTITNPNGAAASGGLQVAGP